MPLPQRGVGEEDEMVQRHVDMRKRLVMGLHAAHACEHVGSSNVARRGWRARVQQQQCFSARQLVQYRPANTHTEQGQALTGASGAHRRCAPQGPNSS